MGEYEAWCILGNYIEEAYAEPLAERRKMLEHAAAGLANMKISIAEHARVWRVLRELDPDDVALLFRLWFATGRVPIAAKPPEGSGAFGGAPPMGPGERRFNMLMEGSGDALLASGCVRISQPGISQPQAAAFGRPSGELIITRAGALVLRGLRSYFAMSEPPSDLPGHEVRENFRTREDALALIRSVPGLYDLVLDCANHFDHSVQYDAPAMAAGVPSNGKGQLILRGVDPARASFITLPNPPVNVEIGVAVDKIWFGQPSPGANDTLDVPIYGPHDVLRVLAYELNAWWP